MLQVVLLEVVLQASKTHPSPHRNTMLLKDGTTSKNMLPRGLTSLLDSGKTKRVQLMGLLGLLGLLLLLLLLLLHAAGGTAGGGAASLQNAPFATPKHHATEGRNDLQKHAAPGLDVPSGFWKKKRLACCCCCWSWWLQLLGLLGLLLPLLLLLLLLLLVVLLELVLQAFQNAPFATPKHHATEGRNDLQKHAAPGLDVPSDSSKNTASSAAGLAGPAGPAAAAAPAACC